MTTATIPAHEFLAAALRDARSAVSRAALRAAVEDARRWAQTIEVARNWERAQVAA